MDLKRRSNLERFLHEDGQTRGLLGSGKVIFKSEIGRSDLSVRFGGSSELSRS